jgi:hypothetical protein
MVRGFPPFRQKKGERMGHGNLYNILHPTLDHPNDEDLSLGTPKPQKQERGEGGAPSLCDTQFKQITAGPSTPFGT